MAVFRVEKERIDCKIAPLCVDFRIGRITDLFRMASVLIITLFPQGGDFKIPSVPFQQCHAETGADKFQLFRVTVGQFFRARGGGQIVILRFFPAEPIAHRATDDPGAEPRRA